MKISLNWLKDYVFLDDKLEGLDELLSSCGLEVEGTDDYTNLDQPLDKVVVGLVKTVKQHPNADKLKLCQVDVGGEESLQIVCGAPNVAEGQKVAVALVGAKLTFSDGKELKIKKGKIRGEVSNGMICAEDELGLGDDHDGIMVLDPRLETGINFADSLEVYEDRVFEIGLTPNRVDAACHMGVARDLSAIWDREMCSRTGLELNVVQNHPDYKVTIEDAQACPRYAALRIKGVKVKASPEWLQNRMKAIGLQSINVIVDITNYIMHDIGQPLHAFDLNEVSGKHIVVRKSRVGEEIITLDDKKRELDGSELLICNAERPMAIAGVLGGKGSGIKDNTTNLLIESAYFDPSSIRRTAKKHQISTDASFRYERGADPEITIKALELAGKMMVELAGGQADSEVLDVYPTVQESKVISFSASDFEKLSGYHMTEKRIVQILTLLGFEVKGDVQLQLTVPTNKPDVERKADVVEELMRIDGFDAIPMAEDMRISLPKHQLHSRHHCAEKAFSWLSSHGMMECKTNPFVSDKFPDSVNVANPLSLEMQSLRKDLLVNGLQNIAYNQNRRMNRVDLFELGNNYSQENGTYKQVQNLCIWQSGQKLKQWNRAGDKADFYGIKKVVESLMSQWGIESEEYQEEKSKDSRFHYALELKINDTVLVTFGKLSDELTKSADVDEDVFAAEIAMKTIYRKYKKRITRFEPINKLPGTERDLSFILPADREFSEVKSVIKRLGIRDLKAIRCFDLYKGENIEKGFVSFAIRIEFESFGKTLKDKQIDRYIKQIIEALEGLGAKIRK